MQFQHPVAFSNGSCQLNDHLTIKACHALLFSGLGDTHLENVRPDTCRKRGGVRSYIFLVDLYLLHVFSLLRLRDAPVSNALNHSQGVKKETKADMTVTA